MRDVTIMESANARKAISRNKGNAYGLKVCVSLITVELLRTATSLYYKDHIFGGQSIIDTCFHLSTTATSLQQPLYFLLFPRWPLRKVSTVIAI